MDAAFEAAEAQAGRGPNDPLIADADWHDAWMLDSVVMMDSTVPESSWDRDFIREVNGLYIGIDRPAPFCWSSMDRIEASDPSGWPLWQYRARAMAGAVRRCLRKGWRSVVVEHFKEATSNGRVSPSIDWDQATDADLLETAARMVATVDAVKAAFAERCSLSVIVHPQGATKYAYWVGGLSPAGHLVGAATHFSTS